MSKKPIGQTRWSQRIMVLNQIYSDVLSNHTLNKNIVIKDAFENQNFDHDQIKVLEYYFDNYQDLEKKIIERLKPTWPYSRINIITKSILLICLSEYYAIGTKPAVLIDQALKTCDHRGLVRDKKFINAILDRIMIKDDR